MGTIRATLHDFDYKTGEPKEPITVEMEYDPNITLEEQGVLKVALYAGDDVGGGSVFIPFAMLSSVMSALMQMHAERNKPKIIMPDTSIIGIKKTN